MVTGGLYKHVLSDISDTRYLWPQCRCEFYHLSAFRKTKSCTVISEGAPRSRARQYLPAIPGYVPVYIRPGDTPLEDINLDLAEAFDSYARKHGRLVFARSHNAVESGREQEQSTDLDDLSLDENEPPKNAIKVQIVNESQHIQKIPRP